MEAIDGIVIDLGLDLEKFENKWKEKFSTESGGNEKLLKHFFPTNLWKGEKDHGREILSQNNSAQIQGMKKQNHEIFGVSKIWDEILKIYFIQNFFFFLKNIFEEKNLSRFWKNPKNFMISFFSSPEFGQKSFPPGKDFDKIPI